MIFVVLVSHGKEDILVVSLVRLIAYFLLSRRNNTSKF